MLGDAVSGVKALGFGVWKGKGREEKGSAGQGSDVRFFPVLRRQGAFR